MCGIVCVKEDKLVRDIILDGLTSLEYRGYDSAGIAIIDDDKKIDVKKKKGKLDNLKQALKSDPFDGAIGIGHIRWATHGAPTDENSHPHLSNDGKIAIVHNGIIENSEDIKKELLEEGYHFSSSTDTEVIAVLLEKHYKGDLLDAIKSVRKLLVGSYALGIISSNEPDRLIGVRSDSPLILGLTETGYILASDIPSMLKYTKKVIYLENDDIVDINKDTYKIYDKENTPVDRKVEEVNISVEAASKAGFDHFMQKEIFEQVEAVAKLCHINIKNGIIDLKDNSFSKEEIEKFNKIYIIACGTAYHAGLVGKYALEKIAEIPVICEIASEFRYQDPFLDENSLVILISQSGETADTLKALRMAKQTKAKTLLITNVISSSIDRESDKSLYCYAGPEIAVASTKAYTTQLVNLYLLAIDFATKLGRIDDETYKAYVDDLIGVDKKIQKILDDKEEFEQIATKIKDKKDLFYLGRGIDYYSAVEASLKLKEVSYIHTEAFPAGELKHGSISLIEEDMPVIAILSQDRLIEKTGSNIAEVRARGAYTILISSVDNESLRKISDKLYKLPEISEILYPILTVIPAQLIAYYTSKSKGIDVDKPRNLAKSVTVE